MASVTKEFLINSMYADPRTDREIGFNNALITILKELVRDAMNATTPSANIVHQRFHLVAKRILGYELPITATDLAEVIQFTNDNLKLQAVKRLKEATNLGLKEAKDVLDAFMI